MKKTTILGLIILFSFINTLQSFSQRTVQIADIKLYNLGDGRLFAENEKKEPIEGKIRIITGYTTEYMDSEFAAGLAVGKWDYYKSNKLAETSHYVDGYKEGESVSYYADGTVQSKTPLKKGVVDGVAYRYNQNGSVEYEKGMKNGVDEDPERTYDKEGNVRSETIYKNGKAEGKSFSKITGNNGDYTQTTYYKSGLQHGDYTEIYDDGSVKVKGKYLDGKKEGAWEVGRNRNGNLLPLETYKAGVVIKKTTYFTNDNVEKEINYNENGKLHGSEKRYDLEGNLKAHFNYVNGKQEGKQVRYITSTGDDYIETETYNASGRKEGEYSEVYVKDNQPKVKGQYQNNNKNGKWTYYRGGKAYQEQIYKNGSLVETIAIP